MKDPEPTEQEVLNAAKLLLASDCALADGMSLLKAVSFASRIFDSLDTAPEWKNGRHSGDCTKTPYTCNRCLVEEYIKEARARWDA